MDDFRRVALYARVSSQTQADEATIRSQVDALERRIAADGLQLEPELRFLDEGYSGATLVRPALERLRDLIHAGGVDVLYLHSPDRLARDFVYSVVLLDEFQKRGVEVVFLGSGPLVVGRTGDVDRAYADGPRTGGERRRVVQPD